MGHKKRRAALEATTNSTVYDRYKRAPLTCSIDPPHQGENASRKPKHGVKKPKYKNKR